jgi:hypothetical protein
MNTRGRNDPLLGRDFSVGLRKTTQICPDDAFVMDGDWEHARLRCIRI